MARRLAIGLYWMWRKGWDYEQVKKFGSHAGQPEFCGQALDPRRHRGIVAIVALAPDDDGDRRAAIRKRDGLRWRGRAGWIDRHRSVDIASIQTTACVEGDRTGLV
jgi:hypothetical protein